MSSLSTLESIIEEVAKDYAVNSKPIVFNRKDCFTCNLLKAYLKEHKVQFVDVDITRTDDERFTTLNQDMTTPLLIKGDKRLTGYDEAILKELFNLS